MVMGWITREHHTVSTPQTASDEHPGVAERRTAQRHVTLLRIGKIITPHRQELCLIRNISSGGLKAQVYARHAAGNRLTVEMGSDERLAGKIVWVKDAHIGVQFDKEIEVAVILGHRADGRRARPPRLDVACPARLRLDTDLHPVTLRDISQGGAKAALDAAIDPGTTGSIAIDGLQPMGAVVRWCHGGLVGLAFFQPIPLHALATWLEQSQARHMPPLGAEPSNMVIGSAPAPGERAI